jgi:hypothetical protein
MRMNELIQPPVGPNYAYEQTAPDTRRGRFIAPSADLSALYGCPHISIIPSMYIIDPLRISGSLDYFVNDHYRVSR